MNNRFGVVVALSAGVVTLLAGGSGVIADTKVWDQPAFGIYGFGSSWAGGVAPGAGDTALFGATLTTTFNPITVLFLQDASAQSVIIESGDYTYDLAANNGSHFMVNNGFSIGTRVNSVDIGLSDTATLRLSGNGRLSTNEGGVFIGTQFQGGFGARDGELVVSDGFQLEVGFSPISVPGSESISVGHNHSGRLVVEGIGSTVTTTNLIAIGVNPDSSGVMTIRDGAEVFTTSVVTGQFGNGNGRIEVDGEGSTLTTTNGGLSIGGQGQGVLTVTNGAQVIARAANIGTFDTGTGSIAVNGAGSTLSIDDQLYIGQGGTGALAITDGAEVRTGGLTFLGSTTGRGTLLVEGAGSQFASRSLVLGIGESGVGEMVVRNGAAATVGSSEGGLVVIGDGTIVVDGQDSTFTARGRVNLGRAGTVSLSNNGEFIVLSTEADPLHTGFMNIGEHETDVGSVEVATSASLRVPSNALNVALYGTGSLLVEQGGIVESMFGRIGRLGESEGVATISGSGSRWDVSTNMYIGGHVDTGAGGTGTLTVRDAGIVTVGTTLTTWDRGAVDVYDGGRLLVGEGDAFLVAPGTLQVGAGGTLSGTGTITGDVVNDGGFIAPGLSAGTLMVDGDLSLLAGAISIELGSVSDLIAVSGIAELGGTLDVFDLGGASVRPGDEFVFLTASSISGSFDQFVDFTPYGLMLEFDGGVGRLVATVPSPGSIVLMGGVGVLAVRRRRIV